jgi:hypothetical protein
MREDVDGRVRPGHDELKNPRRNPRKNPTNFINTQSAWFFNPLARMPQHMT